MSKQRARRAERHEIELSVDGARVAVAGVGGPQGPGGPRAAEHVTFRVPISAGPHLVGVTFVEHSEALDESLVRLRMRSRGRLPAIAMTTIRGPFAATGPGDTPSRQRIFVCRPSSVDDELPCARAILGELARRAYRRPATETDIADLLPFYEEGRAEGSFDTGVQFALERVLVSPQFLYRIEREPAGALPGAAYAVTDLELASRLSFFLWSSIPDDELLQAAIDGTLREPRTLRAQVQRMLGRSALRVDGHELCRAMAVPSRRRSERARHLLVPRPRRYAHARARARDGALRRQRAARRRQRRGSC